MARIERKCLRQLLSFALIFIVHEQQGRKKYDYRLQPFVVQFARRNELQIQIIAVFRRLIGNFRIGSCQQLWLVDFINLHIRFDIHFFHIALFII